MGTLVRINSGQIRVTKASASISKFPMRGAPGPKSDTQEIGRETGQRSSP